ncbi:MAG: nucleotidyl transferase AbiEii/AbiGii toxin family protein [Candidatus Symbiothrix sp.]|jgi:predicted nucleotidyltransferase component of viral defense system|nr:nucleotidyl transferase AbiEii/AbiGii toxin family protein [Candidatus Symbiothrix sp.]
MSIWQQYNNDEKIVILQQTATAKKIIEQAVEKDWWVSAVLMALSKTSLADFLQFKGGTCLSKAWELINRFSEDIDLSISRLFFNLPDETPQQRTTIRREAFHYINEILIGELDTILQENNITDYEIKPVTENSSAMVTSIEVKYKSILPALVDYVLPVVKIEFSAMSLDEPYRKKEITTFIHSVYLEIDNEITLSFKSVLPERTFLEKLFLLHEEYQKDMPRIKRMSRHLYDLEKMMDTPFAETALKNTDLYKMVIDHRKKFNNIRGIDYQTHYPELIQICPPENLIEKWKDDYENMRQSFIYEEPKKTFNELIGRLQELTDRIRTVKID